MPVDCAPTTLQKINSSAGDDFKGDVLQQQAGTCEVRSSIDICRDSNSTNSNLSSQPLISIPLIAILFLMYSLLTVMQESAWGIRLKTLY